MSKHSFIVISRVVHREPPPRARFRSRCINLYFPIQTYFSATLIREDIVDGGDTRKHQSANMRFPTEASLCKNGVEELDAPMQGGAPMQDATNYTDALSPLYI